MWNCWRLRIWAWGTDLYLQMGFYTGEPHIVMTETKPGYSFALRTTVHPKTAAFTSDQKKQVLLWRDNQKPWRTLIHVTSGCTPWDKEGRKSRNPGGSSATLHWMANINKMWSHAFDSSDNQSGLKQSCCHLNEHWVVKISYPTHSVHWP